MKTSRRFQWLSWGITALIVLGLLSIPVFAFRPMARATPAPMQSAGQEPALPSLPLTNPVSLSGITRKLTLKTTIPERPNYILRKYTVEAGDSLFRIARQFNIKPETLLWANYETLDDDPHGLKPGQELFIPATDGLLYEWKADDTVEKVAAQYKTKAEDILAWPGNELDLTNPRFKIGQRIMLPGGWRESKVISLPVEARGPKTGTAGIAGSSCSGAVGTGAFGYPTANPVLSGNDYFPGHLGIDLAGGVGDPVYASDSGVVVKAASGWNGGYGNVIAIDHGNGYMTVYAHLSSINVSLCRSVAKGQMIGLVGSTGNSSGSHLHFEVRLGGANINPWFVFQ